jgi:hypothetical protein
MVAQNQQLTREGPAHDEVQIIGVELAYTRPDGREVELDMFPCRHTLPANYLMRRYQNIRVTLHTSNGDVTIRGDAPW